MRRYGAAWLAGMLLAGCGLIGNDESVPAPVRPSGGTGPVTVTTPGDPFRFAVLGDFGTGDDKQREVAGRMCRWHARHPFEIVFTTGDNIYPDGDPDLFTERFHDVYRCLFDRGVTFRAVVGNHDVMTDEGRPELSDPSFGMPDFNYVVRVAGMRFVMVDSTRLDRSWLRRKVNRASGAKATVVVMHHPVLSAGTGHGSTPGFGDLQRMFRRAGVDLVLQGHDHVYTSTKKLRGVRYVVTGGGGASLRGCLPTAQTAVCAPRHHFLYGEALDQSLLIRAVPRKGPVFHRFRVPLGATDAT